MKGKCLVYRLSLLFLRVPGLILRYIAFLIFHLYLRTTVSVRRFYPFFLVAYLHRSLRAYSICVIVLLIWEVSTHRNVKVHIYNKIMPPIQSISHTGTAVC